MRVRDAMTRGTVRSDGAASATRPPTPSSQARVGNEKNAHGSLEWVSRMHATNDAAEPISKIAHALRV